jgi:hypothetical protein
VKQQVSRRAMPIGQSSLSRNDALFHHLMPDTPTSCCHRHTRQLEVNNHFQVQQEMLARVQRLDAMAHHR